MPDVQISTIERKMVLRLRSWDSQKAVTLGGEPLPADAGGALPGVTRALCMGPGDWLLLSKDSDATYVRERIQADLLSQGLSLVDLSEAYAGFHVRGPLAAEVLSKGCGLDFHPRVFPAGRCARTRFAQVPVVIECIEPGQLYELTVARSYRHYLSTWLSDSAVEFN